MTWRALPDWEPVETLMDVLWLPFDVAGVGATKTVRLAQPSGLAARLAV
jgi:hypothetical protein